jgi:hypothetical protein
LEKKGSASLEALPCTAILADFNLVAYCFEALLVIMPSDFTRGTDNTSVYEVCECDYRQCRSYHRAPSFRLSRYIDPHVTSQVRIFVFTLKVSFAGIYVSFASVVKVVLCFIFGHEITSLVNYFAVDCVPLCLIAKYNVSGNRQCEPDG